MPHEQPHFWQVNVPREEWQTAFPDFLAVVGDKDRSIISTPDSEYTRLSWDRVKEVIRSNRVDLFQRVPSELRKYRQFTYIVIKKYGSMQNFIMQKRLRWTSLEPSADPFVNEAEDMTILYNDWPYGIDQKIVHLVVWTKFELKDDRDGLGDLLPEVRGQIDEWVRKTFHTKMDPERVAWFKNWYSLKSIHAVEHFHVMLYDPDMSFIRELTNGEEPLSSRTSLNLEDL